MPDIGYGALLLAFLSAGYALAALIVGIRRQYPELIRSGENGLKLAALWTIAASIILLYLLVDRQYQVQYVYDHVSNYMRLEYVLSAFWAGQEGSLLLWLLLLTGASLALMGALRDEEGRRLRPYLLGTLALVEAFLALLLILPSNPFTVLPMAPAEGTGLNPLLENVGMIFHPPTLFVGYALYTIPFAFVVAGLLSGQPSDTWMARTRRWSLMAWLFLGVGIILGAWWAYVELGWGGYWAWDPVENSSLIPWLVGTAALHSGAMQYRRGIFRIWTAALNMLTFGLCVFATFVTRSGVIQSVHAFGRSPIGAYFAIFLALMMAGGFGLLIARRRTLFDAYQMESYLSREAGFLLTNFLLVGSATVVLLGTIFPAITELIQGQQVALGVEFYNRAFSPLGLAIILLFGICPILGWRETSLAQFGKRLIIPGGVMALGVILLLVAGYNEPVALVGFGAIFFVAANILSEFVRGVVGRSRSTDENPLLAATRLIARDRRRYGGMIVHLSILLITLGIVGAAAYKTEQQVALKPGEQLSLGQYTIDYVNFSNDSYPEKERYATTLDVYVGDRLAKTLIPEKNFHWNIEQWVSEVAVWSRLNEDLYIALGGLSQDGTATYQIMREPLMIWMWIGGFVLVLGAVVAWWPAERGARRRASQAEG
jgi:cytochrome c-type biogenesis protein CcmF